MPLGEGGDQSVFVIVRHIIKSSHGAVVNQAYKRHRSTNNVCNTYQFTSILSIDDRSLSLDLASMFDSDQSQMKIFRYDRTA